ncbi:MAG TPA: hypothetical protein VF503_30350 [Sphingobium sp.]
MCDLTILTAAMPEFRLDPDMPATCHGGHVPDPKELHTVWETIS